MDGSLLHSACRYGYHEYCEILMKDGFDMKRRNCDNKTFNHQIKNRKKL